LLAAVLAALGALVMFLQLGKPLLPIPAPPDLEKLEPQLQAYIREQITLVHRAPRQARSHATLGLVYAANGLWAPARAAFENAVQLDSHEPLALLYLAVADQEIGDPDKALAELRRLTAQFPDFPPGQYRLGEALLRAGAVTEAQACFERLINLAPAEWRGFAGLGDARLRQGNAAEAAALLEKAVKLDAGAKPAHHMLGQAYQRLGRLEDAQRELRLGLDATSYPMPDPWSVEAPRHMRLLRDLVEMAKQYSDAGTPAKAVSVLEAVLPYQTNNLGLLNNLAIAYNQSGQPQKALGLLERALRANDHYVPARVALSATCLALDRKEEALDHARRATALAPHTVQPLIAEANALLALERDSEALEVLADASKLDPQNAQIHVEMGDICLLNLDRPTDALGHFQKATELDPTLVRAWAGLAKTHLRGNTPALARPALEALRKLAPDAKTTARIDQKLRTLPQP